MTGGYVEKSFAPAPADLEAIGAFTRRAFAPEELYVFSVVLCNNDVDRDHEKFTRQALEKLGALFVGKTGIFDHSMKSGDQAARIYATAVVPVPGRKTADGEDLVTLQAKAYMVRTPGNAELITQIDGGIKKEVSVGCSVERCVCSICGEDINTCAHKKGEVYGGKVCCAELVNAQDAYEWSFVAVPAQPRAGVLKRCGGEDAGTLKTLVKRRGSRANQRELESLEKQAEVGKRYLSELRGEVKRLMLVCEQEADGEAVEKLAEKLDESELKEMEKLYRGKMAKKLGLRTQLTYGEKTKAAEDESDFRV